MSDNELQAMGAVAEALDPLDEGARQRVLRWAADRFEIDPIAGVQTSGSGEGERLEGGDPQFSDLGDLVHVADPRKGTEYALAVAYWFQVVEGKGTWGGGDINNALKDLGHGLSNVTKTLKSLMDRKPAFVMQTSKAGRSRQARKTYRLTAAGVARVKEMLSGDVAR
jgi:hypothetical protein